MNNDNNFFSICVSIRDSSNNSELVLTLHHRLNTLLSCVAAVAHRPP